MTDSFVPFEGRVTFAGGAENSPGTIVFEKSNPSGLPEHAAEVRIPIRFGPDTSSAANDSILAYFSNSGLDSAAALDCAIVFPVERAAPATAAPARAALEALLQGPTVAERAQGFTTNLPPGVEIRRLVIANDTAAVDFSAELEPGGGSCRVTAIRAQIERTLLQFASVKAVRISIAGRSRGILQP
jgi:spore germination protein GerM